MSKRQRETKGGGGEKEREKGKMTRIARISYLHVQTVRERFHALQSNGLTGIYNGRLLIAGSLIALRYALVRPKLIPKRASDDDTRA